MTFRLPFITPQKPPVSSPPQAIGPSIALLTAVVAVPFIPIDMSGSVRVRAAAVDQIAYNPNLYSQTVVPINVMVGGAQAPLPAPPPTYLNLVINTTTVAAAPFIPIDWSRSVVVPHWPPPTTYPNLSITNPNPIPFAQYQWPRVIPLPPNPPQAQPYNNELFTNPIPFAKYDWSKPSAFGPTPAAPIPLNLSLNFTVFAPPFAQYQWPSVSPVRPVPPQPATANLSLLTIPVPVPFIPIDWSSRPFFPRLLVDASRPLNPNLQTNPIPFGPYDYSRGTKTVPSALYDLSHAPNPSLFTNPAPFAQYSWPLVAQPAPTPLYVPQNFTNLITPPPAPTTPAQYVLLVPHYVNNGYYPADTIVTEGIEIPFGWPPTIAVEPLNSVAIQNYWNQGPKPLTDAEAYRDFFPFFQVYRRTIYWLPTGIPGQFQLTGAGASLGPRT